MSFKKKNGKKLPTDKNTDYLFDYFMNEEKFNEQLRGEWDEKLQKKLENAREPKLDSRIVTDKNEKNSSEKPEELPSISNSDNQNRDVEFNDDFSENENIRENYNSRSEDNYDYHRQDDLDGISPGLSVRSPYKQKIDAVPEIPPVIQRPKEIHSERPLLGEKLIDDIEKYAETPEEKRARARDAYSQLQDLVEKYNIKLTRPFTIDDDPDEMEEEARMHRERRHKNNQVKFYKNILLNIICGVEFLNDKYNPFEFKLKDWSKQISADLDDYTEVLEEIYEKYKDRGGKMAPEIRLLFMIIMSGVTYHLSNTLFGSGGLNNTIQNNPNILNKLLGGLMKGDGAKIFGENNAEPVEVAPNNKNILEALRKHNKNKSEMNTTTDVTEPSKSTSEALALEREKRLLAEQKAMFETQLRKQNEMYTAQMEDLRKQINNQLGQTSVPEPQKNNNVPAINYPPAPSPINQVLSDATRKPRFQENPLIVGVQNNNTIMKSDEPNIFESEIRENTIQNSKKNKNASAKKQNKINFDELLESLEQSTDIDLDDVIETSSKKRKNNKIVTTIKKPKNNSVIKSIKGKRSEGTSDVLSTTKRKDNVIKL